MAEVSETITKEGRTIRFKLHDKKGSLELLGRHLGMFPTKVEHTGEEGGPIPFTFIIGKGYAEKDALESAKWPTLGHPGRDSLS